MPSLVPQTRQYWLPGLNTVSGRHTAGLSGWFTNGDYQVFDPLTPSALASTHADIFVLTVGNRPQFLASVAADCSRMMSAAIESVASIRRIDTLPRSGGWLVVKSYYSSFFAAHAILRMLGTCCVHLDTGLPADINKIITLYGMANGLSVTSGGYTCTYDPVHHKLTCTKDSGARGGSHQAMWAVFLSRVRQLGNDILAGGVGLIVERQDAVRQLDELATNLAFAGYTANGGWLSAVRNKVNYQQDLGVWFPYTGRDKASADSLYTFFDEWTSKSCDIPLTSRIGGELFRFVRTSMFIVRLAREMADDMSVRHPSNRSFYTQGPIAILKLLRHGTG